MQQGQALFVDVLATTTAFRLKDSLLAVAASIRSGGDSSSSTIAADLWRCLALLYKMHSAIKDPSLQQQTSQGNIYFVGGGNGKKRREIFSLGLFKLSFIVI